jgi:hypothetical protein
MEQKDAYTGVGMDDIANALEAIFEKASITADNIGHTANEVGCAYEDSPAAKRLEAMAS